MALFNTHIYAGMIKGTMNTTTNLFILLIVISFIIPSTAIRYAQGQPGCEGDSCEPATAPQEDNSTGNTTAAAPQEDNSTGNTTSTGGSTENNTTSTGALPPPVTSTGALPPPVTSTGAPENTTSTGGSTENNATTTGALPPPSVTNEPPTDRPDDDGRDRDRDNTYPNCLRTTSAENCR